MSSAPARSEERGLVSYLLVPRPADLPKVVFAPGAYLLAAVTVGGFDRVGEFVALWLTLEFLVYYARYQWNDVRGLADDHRHSERSLRARLPAGATNEKRRRNVYVSLAIAGTRLLVAVVVGVALGALATVVILILAVFAIAILYEALRSHQPERVRRDAGPREVSVWMVVGLGYAVRAGLGLALAGLTLKDTAMNLGLLLSAALGSMYVLLNWALEGSNSCIRVNEHWIVSEALRAKPHISTLLRYIDGSHAGSPSSTTTPEQFSRRTPGHLGVEKVLEARGDVMAPWNVALLIGAALAGLLTIELTAPDEAWAEAAAVALCVAGAGGLCSAGNSTRRHGIVAAAAVLLETLAFGAADSVSAWPAPLPWLALAGTYAAFRSFSYLDSMGVGSGVAGALVKPARGLLMLVIGERTWAALHIRQRAREDSNL